MLLHSQYFEELLKTKCLNYTEPTQNQYEVINRYDMLSYSRRRYAELRFMKKKQKLVGQNIPFLREHSRYAHIHVSNVKKSKNNSQVHQGAQVVYANVALIPRVFLPEDFAGEQFLLLLQLQNPLLDGVVCDHPHDLHLLGLPDPVDAVHGLFLDSRVPPRLEQVHPGGHGEVYPSPRSSQARK